MPIVEDVAIGVVADTAGGKLETGHVLQAAGIAALAIVAAFVVWSYISSSALVAPSSNTP